MIPSEIRKMANPYVPMTPRLLPEEFIGRESEVAKLHYTIDEYRKTQYIRNIIISGDRSIGKSTLVNRYKQILEDNNFIVYEVELQRDPSLKIDEFEFFKDLFDYIFERYAPPEGYFFDELQSEIWFSLTTDKYEHESDFKDRRLNFASKYASKKRGIDEKLSVNQLKKDFEVILEQIISKEMEIDGLAIIIDEFQELPGIH